LTPGNPACTLLEYIPLSCIIKQARSFKGDGCFYPSKGDDTYGKNKL